MSAGATVRTSVVVPAYEAWDTLPATLEALAPQVQRGDRELILVESSATTAAEELSRRWPWARVVALEQRTLPGAARNIGVERTRGELIAFTDADAVPDARWLDALEDALNEGVDVVAGAVLNGTAGSAVGTAGYVLEFADWLPERRGTPLHGATCNLLVRKAALEAAGGFRSDLHPGEDTLVTFPLARRGRLVFEPAACVRHLNRTRWGDALRHQYRLGRSFAQVCREVDFPRRAFARFPLTLAAGPLRVPVVWLRLARWHALSPRTVAAAPAALALACAWTVGLTAGALRAPDRRAAAARI